jgi:hypothetical protein
VRRSLAALGFLAAGAAAGLAFWRHRAGGARERVDVYFSDGSMVSFPPGSPEGETLLPLARGALAAARGA